MLRSWNHLPLIVHCQVILASLCLCMNSVWKHITQLKKGHLNITLKTHQTSMPECHCTCNKTWKEWGTVWCAHLRKPIHSFGSFQIYTSRNRNRNVFPYFRNLSCKRIPDTQTPHIRLFSGQETCLLKSIAN